MVFETQKSTEIDNYKAKISKDSVEGGTSSSCNHPLWPAKLGKHGFATY